jgi:MoxR-like ATPase
MFGSLSELENNQTTSIKETLMDIKQVRNKFKALNTDLQGYFAEREHIINGILVGVIAKQHILLLGPPGTAKTLLAQSINNSIEGSQFFSWLLTKFSTPEEVFGPISLQGLKENKYERILSNKLPEAHIALLDEIFKANSSILNSLLSIVNERIYYNGTQPVRCPLISAIGTSNELPEGDELNALYDRFAIKFHVDYIKNQHLLKNLLTDNMAQYSPTNKISLEEIAFMQAEAEKLPITEEFVQILLNIKQHLETEGIVASDRKWKQIISILKASALIEGYKCPNEESLLILPHLLWTEPKQLQKIRQVIMQQSNSGSMRAIEIQDAAHELMRILHQMPRSSSSERGEWVKQATAVNSALKDMGRELCKLENKLASYSSNGPIQAPLIDKVQSQLENFNKEISAIVTTIYS